MCGKAFEQLQSIEERLKTHSSVKAVPDVVAKEVANAGVAKDKAAYVQTLASSLVNCKVDSDDGADELKASGSPRPRRKQLFAPLAKLYFSEVVEEDDGDDAELLCDCKFTLAYGSKVLLHNTKLKLKRGHKYGLLGGNDSGKTTLMRSIANEQVDGFPPASELRTVFVEADIIGELSDLPCVDYILADPRIKKAGISEEVVERMLISVGFGEMQNKARTLVTFLSGGWRMKLALARAMCLNADILLMDEPTNHLDVMNVKWVEEYLLGLKNVTCIIVSHDTGLLDRVCNNIIAIDTLKLKQSRGNLSEYMRRTPRRGRSSSSRAAPIRHALPQPVHRGGQDENQTLDEDGGRHLHLPGERGADGEGRHRAGVVGVARRVRRAERRRQVHHDQAVDGRVVPQEGSVWKHPNARVAAVARTRSTTSSSTWTRPRTSTSGGGSSTATTRKRW